MRRIVPTLLLLFAGSFFPAIALETGNSMPVLSEKLKNVDGSEKALPGFFGKAGTLVIFSCNACPFAKAWEDRILNVGRKFNGKGIGMVMINSNDPKKVAEDGFEEMQKRAKAKNYPFPYVVDETSNVARAFGATRTPEVYLFDSKGVLVYQGAVDDNSGDPKGVTERYLESSLEALLAGKKPAADKTKAIGCTIKFRSS